jgi:hypothetical protein
VSCFNPFCAYFIFDNNQWPKKLLNVIPFSQTISDHWHPIPIKMRQAFLSKFGPGQLAFISSLWSWIVTSQLSSKSTLPFAGLQHMQQCQVNFHSIFASMLWSEWMVHEKWSPQWGFEPRTSQSWVFYLNH